MAPSDHTGELNQETATESQDYLTALSLLENIAGLNVPAHNKLLALAGLSVVQAMAANWTDILQSADESSEEPAKVALTLALDVIHKSPAGALRLSFSKKYKDESTFRVDDPEQEQMEL